MNIPFWPKSLSKTEVKIYFLNLNRHKSEFCSPKMVFLAQNTLFLGHFLTDVLLTDFLVTCVFEPFPFIIY